MKQKRHSKNKPTGTTPRSLPGTFAKPLRLVPCPLGAGRVLCIHLTGFLKQNARTGSKNLLGFARSQIPMAKSSPHPVDTFHLCDCGNRRNATCCVNADFMDSAPSFFLAQASQTLWVLLGTGGSGVTCQDDAKKPTSNTGTTCLQRNGSRCGYGHGSMAK